MDALLREHFRTLDASFEASLGCQPERMYYDCGCVAAGRPGLDVRGDVCPYCYGETRHELPF